MNEEAKIVIKDKLRNSRYAAPVYYDERVSETQLV